MSSPRPLTPLQARFVTEYLIDLNSSQAVIRAGYQTQYPTKLGPQLLAHNAVRAAIADAISAREARTHITQDKVLRELARLAFTDMRDYVHWGPDGIVVQSSSALTRDQAAAVIEVSETTSKDGHTVRVKLADKEGSLDKLAKHLRLYPSDRGMAINLQGDKVAVVFQFNPEVL